MRVCAPIHGCAYLCIIFARDVRRLCWSSSAGHLYEGAKRRSHFRARASALPNPTNEARADRASGATRILA
jgi:hypothetical protein